jgi:hypothetical protein
VAPPSPGRPQPAPTAQPRPPPARRRVGTGLTGARRRRGRRDRTHHIPLTLTSALGSITIGGVTSGRSLHQTVCSPTAARRPAPQATSSGVS